MRRTTHIRRWLLSLTLLTLLIAVFVMPAHAAEWDAYEAVVANILDEDVIDGMSDTQLALYIHDSIAMIGRYDTTYKRGTAYDLLANGSAVCSGYAEAYQDLMTRVGIPCVTVSSSKMDHAWNLVKIDGNWYHVDLTWDDNQTQAAGFVKHDNFLLSDAGIAATGHSGWKTDIACTDTRYDDGSFWKTSKSQICYTDSSVSYQREGSFADSKVIKLTRRNSITGETTLLREIEFEFLHTGGWGFYTPSYGLSLWDNVLYYSDMKAVYGVCTVTGEQWVVYEHDYSSSGLLIYSSRVADNMIYLTLQDSWGDAEETTVPLDTSSHPHSYTITKSAATCKAGGSSTHSCSCGSSFQVVTSNAGPHSYGSYVVTNEPTMNTKGAKESKCVWCGTVDKTSIPSLSQMKSLFTDVDYNEYYGTPVLWAAARGVTNGTGGTYFSPNDPCTRAQIVTFLWRAMGEPEPTTTNNPFNDVKRDDYFYKAVLWAVEKGITKGISSTEFAPNDACTRAQVVTFLHRTAGTPTSSGSHSFTDVTKDYYYNAMLWAVKNGITTGTSSTTFSPNDTCTRGQIVTFLYRYIMQ